MPEGVVETDSPESDPTAAGGHRSLIVRVLVGFVLIGIGFVLPEPNRDAVHSRTVERTLASIFGEWNDDIAESARPAGSDGTLFVWKNPPDLPRIPVEIRSVDDSTPVEDGRVDLDAVLEFGALRGLSVLDFASSESERDPLEVEVQVMTAADSAVEVVLRTKLPENVGGVSTAEWSLEGRTEIPRSRSCFPPLIVLAVAIVLRRAVIALVAGVVAGILIHAATASGASAIGTFDAVVLESVLLSSFRIEIVLFVLLLVGMIGIVTRSGGTAGLVEWVTRKARGARGTRLSTAFLGLLVFFDDYSNTIIVGTSMRPLTDKLRIAREKLAYLIDSTAAPVAGIALFSTWIGYEVAQYESALLAVGADGNSAYSVFLQTIPYRFYCLFTLALVFTTTILGRDFGPMRKAEVRAATTGQLHAPGAKPLASKRLTDLKTLDGVEPRAHRALVPIVVVIISMLVGFFIAGRGVARLGEFGGDAFSSEQIVAILGNEHVMRVSCYAAALGVLAALLTSLPKIGLENCVSSFFSGSSSLVSAIAILVSAWALAEICTPGYLQTGEYLVSTVGRHLSLELQPLVFFGLACVVAFATGTSWGTMAILLPISIPVVWASSEAAGLEGMNPVTLLAFGAVLEGSIFGDHCSPISDTTVLSSVASGSDHLDHVKTQAPYAITSMGICVIFGYLPVAFGWYGPGVALLLGVAATIGFTVLVGRKIPDGSEAA